MNTYFKKYQQIGKFMLTVG